MNKILLCIILIASLNLFSQDTLTFMQYNLLNYGNYTDYCTSLNNNIEVTGTSANGEHRQ